MKNRKQTTQSMTTQEAQDGRRWFVVDATDMVVGRLASQIANTLRGKNSPRYTPHTDTGDFVVVINAGKVKFTGTKPQKKIYHRHTGWVGGIRSNTAEALLQSKPEMPLKLAVWGMMPKGPLGRDMFKKLKIFAGAEHPHQAQKAQPLTLIK